ncbi:hypothetical protein C0J52_05021 [Blattella germanica]|nr:hypothetical protein C0J52_05021 [Blattella germanica]
MHIIHETKFDSDCTRNCMIDAVKYSKHTENLSIPLRETSAEENTIKACFIRMDGKLLIGSASSIPVNRETVEIPQLTTLHTCI